MHSKEAEGIANNVDPDQTSLAIWPGSALFVHAYLSENLGSYRYDSKHYMSCITFYVNHQLQEICKTT